MNNYFPEHELDTKRGDSNYLKFKEEGIYRFRQMATNDSKHHFIEGWVAFEKYYDEDDLKNEKPRYRRHCHHYIEGEKATDELVKLDKNGNPSYFWAFVVFHEGAPKILEITQKTIMRQMVALVIDPDWGDPREYDMTVTRTGQGKDNTTYNVSQKPKSSITQEMLTIVGDAKIDLRVMFDRGEPFGALVDDQRNIQEIYEQPNEQLARIADNAMNR